MNTFGLSSPSAGCLGSGKFLDDDGRFLREERPPAIGKEDDPAQKSDGDYVKPESPAAAYQRCMVATKLDPAGDHVVVVATPTGRHTDGGSGSSSSGDGGASYLRWAESLKSLLDDSDGVRLFKQFLEQVREGRLKIVVFTFGALLYHKTGIRDDSQQVIRST